MTTYNRERTFDVRPGEVQMTIKRVPVEGALLKELRIYGTGKRCWVKLETIDPPATVQFMLYHPTFEIDLRGQVRTVIFADDSDRDLGVKYIPLEDLRVQSFVADFRGTKREWRETVKEFFYAKAADPFGCGLEPIELKIVAAKDLEREPSPDNASTVT